MITKFLHERAIEAAKNFHTAESDLISILQEVDEAKEYLAHEYTSLFAYAVGALKLSEPNASNFITIARKSVQIPEFKRAIDEGKITVSKARKITPVITKENKNHWLDLATTLSKNKLEKEVAKIKPETLTIEKARYVTDMRLELRLGVSEKIMQDLRRAQDLISQKTRSTSTLETTLEDILDFYLQRNDPLEKAKRNINANASVPGHIPHSNQRRPLNAQTEHQVNLRDQGCCTHINQRGEKCENKR